MNSVIYIIPNHLYINNNHTYTSITTKSKAREHMEKRLKSIRKSNENIKRMQNQRPWFGITFDNYC
jgi:hypothetical protein